MLQNPRQLIQLLFTTPFLLTIFGPLAFSQRLDIFFPSIIDSFNTSNFKYGNVVFIPSITQLGSHRFPSLFHSTGVALLDLCVLNGFLYQPQIGQLQPNISSKAINPSEVVLDSPTPTKFESSQLLSSPFVAADQDTSVTLNSNPSVAASSFSANPPEQELQVRRRLEFGKMECSPTPDDTTC